MLSQIILGDGKMAGIADFRSNSSCILGRRGRGWSYLSCHSDLKRHAVQSRELLRQNYQSKIRVEVSIHRYGYIWLIPNPELYVCNIFCEVKIEIASKLFSRKCFAVDIIISVQYETFVVLGPSLKCM